MIKKIAFFTLAVGILNAHSPKILHISFHKGCIIDIEDVAKELKLDVTSWFIHDTPGEFDGYTRDSQIYNISHARAADIWEKNKNYFNQFDGIITSDTAPLSRIFLQNNWQKPLIIWVCNRFDYAHQPSIHHFPDQEYFNLLQHGLKLPNVRIISYTEYEHVYARNKRVELGRLVIKPIGSIKEGFRDGTHSAIPKHIEQESTLFINPRGDNHYINYIAQSCAQRGITTYSGPYNGPHDLIRFKGIIYFPYAWSNLALFENIQRGIIHFVPSPSFLLKIHSSVMPIHWPNFNQYYTLTEWYQPEYAECFVFFDSWDDLAQKIKTTDYEAIRTKILKKGKEHRAKMLEMWQAVMVELF